MTHAHDANNDDRWEDGGFVGRYHLDGLPRKGGNGEVWRAIDVELDRLAAVKRLTKADAASRVRFLQEARVTARLQNPGVVPVYEPVHQSDDEGVWYAMLFVDGKTLGEEIRDHHREARPNGADSLRRLLVHFVRACRTVHFAHCQHVLHLDLKPINIMIGNSEETYVMDWGSAMNVDPDLNVDTAMADIQVRLETSEGEGNGSAQLLPGTVEYMAPEHVLGQRDLLGPWTDVFCLGATLYHLLVGDPPFARGGADDKTSADTTALGRRIVTGELSPPRRHKGVPPALDAICLTAMATDPQQRYASAGHLADDIERWLAGDCPVAYKELWWERASRVLRRHAVKFAVAIALLLAVLAVVGTALFFVVRANRQLAEERRRAEELAVKTGEIAKPLSVAAGALALLEIRGRLTPEQKAAAFDSRARARDAQDEAIALLRALPLDVADRAVYRRASANLALARGMHYGELDLPPSPEREPSRAEQVREDWKRAEDLLRSALDDWTALAAPEDQEARANVALCHSFLGVLHRKMGRQPIEIKKEWVAGVEVWEGVVRDFPKATHHARNLGREYYQLGVLAEIQGNYEEVLEWQTKAVERLTPFATHDEERWFLASAHLGRGVAYLKIQKPDYDAARKEFETSTNHTQDGNEKRDRRLWLATADAYRGDHVNAVADAKKALGLGPKDDSERVALARVLSVASAAARKDPQAGGPTADRHVEEAVGLLKKAHAAGYFKDADNRDILRDCYYLPLEGRDDFRALR